MPVRCSWVCICPLPSTCAWYICTLYLLMELPAVNATYFKTKAKRSKPSLWSERFVFGSGRTKSYRAPFDLACLASTPSRGVFARPYPFDALDTRCAYTAWLADLHPKGGQTIRDPTCISISGSRWLESLSTHRICYDYSCIPGRKYLRYMIFAPNHWEPNVETVCCCAVASHESGH